MVQSRAMALARAMASTTNVPGTCQLWVRNKYDAPSAGDQDHDGDADAVDGWLSEPKAARHPGDRNPPPGVPVSFSGGSHGFGHRAMSRSLGGNLRSTDMRDGHYSPGHVGNATIAQIEQQLGQHYLGWSETIDGIQIPYDRPAPKKGFWIVCQEVIDGKWGTGDARLRLLKEAGYHPAAIQDGVNELLAKKASTPVPAPSAPKPSYTPVPNKLLGLVLQLPGMYNRFSHLDPYAYGNSDAGDNHAVAHGYVSADRDFQVTKDLVMINTHWGDTREFEKTRRYWRNLTWAQVKDFKSINGGHRLRTFQHTIEHMKKAGLKRMEFEAKGSKAFEGPTGDTLFHRVAHQRDKVGFEVVVKSLTSITGCWRRLYRAHGKGLVTIVLPRGLVRTSGSFKQKYAGVADYYR